MAIALGIDTGGTYTDGVLFLLDLSTGNIKAKVKALTTRENLVLGIRECIRNMPMPAGQIMQSVNMLIKARTEEGFIVHAPFERVAFLCLKDATQYA